MKPILQIPTPHLPLRLPHTPKTSPFPTLPPPKTHVPIKKLPPFLNFPAILASQSLLLPFPSPAAAESELLSPSDKINIESILVSIDDFFNRYPFFVAGCTFIWLVVIPLTEEYLKKYKFVSAIDAFRKLRDDPSAQLLDIRKKQSLDFMRSPNLRILGKSAVQVEFTEGGEEGFLREVKKRFGNPESTVLCVLDNFDGKSLEVAELLFKNGFKEAYAIKGGLRGNDGWQAIQETLLPPAVHVYPRKKKRNSSVQLEEIRLNTDDQNTGNGQAASSAVKQEQNQN
ncbi:rhodanese-like domain-containing protein 4A, chloroplastic [Iris pallida]|uniref:Rhodanese-like domain-containing protein 4A, chloroplastic n=1 Tax=Iris pallida TaxID=29817 RepID=A0AAX6E3F3_IRIPA|nr:rhodanese-like domain-containing protein 4A, chloroplastic [Iris pallida]